MSVLLPCSGALATALAAGNIKEQADIYSASLLSGAQYYWTSYNTSLVIGGLTYVATPIKRGRRSLTYTMTVPQLDIEIEAANATPNLKSEAVLGLFDGGQIVLARAYMPTPGDTTTYGIITLFVGDVGQVQVTGNRIALTVKGRNNKLDMNAPRNVYQSGCLNTFCDAACTLSAGSFTHAFTVGSSPAPSSTFVPWATPPGNPKLYVSGKLTMTSGAANGLGRSIVAADSTGVTLVYPLPIVPTAGDSFNALQGCDKTLGLDATGGAITPSAGGNCNGYSNVANFRGFPYVPTPEQTANGMT